MSIPNNIQQVFFEQIKDRLPTHISLVHELAEVLNISDDGVYRRLRCKTSLTFDEIQLLATKYGLSVDSLMGNQLGAITFSYPRFVDKHFNYEQYLNDIANNLETIASFDEKQIIHVVKDIPFFHLFHIPEIGAFKLFFWARTIFDNPELKDKLFSLEEDMSDKMIELGKNIINTYIKIPSIELWNEEAIHATLKQIEIYCEAGLFRNKKEAVILCDKLIELLSHIKSQAEYGFKYLYGLKPVGRDGNYKLYRNELILGDNANIVKTGDTKTTYINYNSLNFLQTTNAAFCQETEEWLNNLIKRSSLISSASERQRNQFFLTMEEKVNKLKEKIT